MNLRSPTFRKSQSSMANGSMIMVLFGFVLWTTLAGNTGVVGHAVTQAPTCNCPPATIADSPKEKSHILTAHFTDNKPVTTTPTSLIADTTTEKASVDVDIPTLQPADDDYDAFGNAVLLHSAVGGMRIFSDPVINILTKRTREQRIEIVEAYNSMYRRDFLSEIEAKFDYWFHYAVAALVRPLADFWAHELHWALKGPGTNELAIIEILTPLSNQELSTLRWRYFRIFGSNLLDDLMDDLSGAFASLVSAQIRGMRSGLNRNSNAVPTTMLAKYLHEEEKAGSVSMEHRVFYDIITKFSYPELRNVSEEFKKLGHTLQSTMQSIFDGWDLRALTSVLTYADGKIGFFVDELKKSYDHFSTEWDLRPIIRIITWRAEIDLGNIKQSFAMYTRILYKISLAALVELAATGRTQKLLLALVGR